MARGRTPRRLGPYLTVEHERPATGARRIATALKCLGAQGSVVRDRAGGFGVALALAGYLLRRPVRIFCLAAGLALALLVIDRIMGGASEPLRVDSGTCDPTCGISAGGMAILVFLTVLILASVGGVLHAIVRRL